MKCSVETSTSLATPSISPRRESQKALCAMRESLDRISRIVRKSRPGQWVERHPYAAAATAAGVSVVATAAIAATVRNTGRRNGNAPPMRVRGLRWLAAAGRMLAMNWLSENVLRPASSEFLETASGGGEMGDAEIGVAE